MPNVCLGCPTKMTSFYSWPYFVSDREKLLRFEAEGREFAKLLRSLKQFIQTVKGQKNTVNNSSLDYLKH